MRCLSYFAASILVFVSLDVLSGCNGQPPAPTKADGAVSPSAEKADPAKLSAEDRKLAEKQGVCPVSGEKLGSMGEPYKVVVKGRTVFLCCEGCKRDDLLANPDKYLAKLSAAESKK